MCREALNPEEYVSHFNFLLIFRLEAFFRIYVQNIFIDVVNSACEEMFNEQ